MADDLHLDLTGTGVYPETVDATASLGLAVALLQALVAVGAYEDPSDEAPFFLALTKMEGNSVHLAFQPSPKSEATEIGDRALDSFHHAAKRLPLYLRGEEIAPKELRKPLDRLRQLARALPANMNASVRILDEKISLSELTTTEVQLITTAETVRAYIMWAGGVKPRVHLRMPGQKQFTASIRKGLIAAESFRVYRDADVTGVFQRDPRFPSPIVSGDVVDVRIVVREDRVEAFDRWYKDAGSPWKGVTDIEEELRRRGSH